MRLHNSPPLLGLSGSVKIVDRPTFVRTLLQYGTRDCILTKGRLVRETNHKSYKRVVRRRADGTSRSLLDYLGLKS